VKTRVTRGKAERRKAREASFLRRFGVCNDNDEKYEVEAESKVIETIEFLSIIHDHHYSSSWCAKPVPIPALHVAISSLLTFRSFKYLPNIP
jgi:hypothetical protein